MATLLDLRNGLKNSLSGTFSVYNSIPEMINVPCVVLEAENPYLEPTYLGKTTVRFAVNLKAIVVVAMLDNESAQDNIEKAIIQIYKTVPSNWVVGNTSRPTPTVVGQGEYLSAEIELQTVFSE